MCASLGPFCLLLKNWLLSEVVHCFLKISELGCNLAFLILELKNSIKEDFFFPQFSLVRPILKILVCFLLFKLGLKLSSLLNLQLPSVSSTHLTICFSFSQWVSTYHAWKQICFALLPTRFWIWSPFSIGWQMSCFVLGRAEGWSHLGWAGLGLAVVSAPSMAVTEQSPWPCSWQPSYELWWTGSSPAQCFWNETAEDWGCGHLSCVCCGRGSCWKEGRTGLWVGRLGFGSSFLCLLVLSFEIVRVRWRNFQRQPA